MAYKFNNSCTIMASVMQSTSSWKKYVGWFLLGYGESGNYFLYIFVGVITIHIWTWSKNIFISCYDGKEFLLKSFKITWSLFVNHLSNYILYFLYTEIKTIFVISWLYLFIILLTKNEWMRFYYIKRLFPFNFWILVLFLFRFLAQQNYLKNQLCYRLLLIQHIACHII